MRYVRVWTIFAVIFALCVSPAAAQWQAPKHSVPIGRGGGAMGFDSALSGSSGLPLVSNGPSSNPSFGTLRPVGGGTGADNSAAVVNDTLAYSGVAFVRTALLSVLNSVCRVSPAACNLFFGYYNILWFGFKCDGTSETSVLQTAVNALPAGGGEIYFPPGANCNDASFVTVNKHNVLVRGASMKNEFADGVSVLNYNGTGGTTSQYIDARDNRGFQITGMQITYSSASFTGSLIDISGTVPGSTVSAYDLIDNNRIGTNTSRPGSATLVNVSGSISIKVSRNFFFHGKPAILGQTVLAQSNAVSIIGNTFVQSDAVPISSCGEAWRIEGNSFEPTASGQASAFANISTLPCHGMVWSNKWLGDGVTPGGTWIDGYFQGVTFSGNQIGGDSTGTGTNGIKLNTSGGVTFIGNRFETINNAIDCNTPSSVGVVVQGNYFASTITRVANPGNCLALVNSGNGP